MSDSASTPNAAPRPNRGARLIVGLAVYASLLLVSFLRHPVPGVNEPNYLTKAKHYWQPEWIEGDVFLDSANPHLFFYQTFGWLPVVFDLHTAAIIGRPIGLGLLAWGWCYLVRSFDEGKQPLQMPLWSAWLWLSIAVFGEVSGEWVVGGIEGKVPGYAFALIGLGATLRMLQRSGCEKHAARLPYYSAIGFGLAFSFHPVVGGWFLVGIAMAISFALLLRIKLHSPAPGACGFAFVLLLITSLPGWLGIFGMQLRADGKTVAAANVYQVFGRLQHHLDPYAFLPWTGVPFGIVVCICVVFAILRWLAGKETSWRLLILFNLAAFLIAMCGVLIAIGPRPASELPHAALRAMLLKFYPFRLIDAVLPMTVGVLIPSVLCSRIAENWPHVLRSTRTLTTMSLLPFLILLSGPAVDPWPEFYSQKERDDWIAICERIRTETPQDSEWLTPLHSVRFKWYAQRAEFVSEKDMPQDARSMMEWIRRQETFRDFAEEFRAGGFTQEELMILQQRTGCDFLLIDRPSHLPLPKVFENDTFRVYRFLKNDAP